MSDALYSATSTAWGGREGRVVSSDERLDLQLSIPAAIGGDDGPGTNPEQLFATGWAACFHSALKLVARQQKADVSESAVSVTVGLVMNAEGAIDITGRIEAELPGLDHATASALVDEAHKVCPYSRATRGNIAVEVSCVEP
ncbi:MAG TPA: organic hydroperoxide resistance protein [Acidimicrobiales bacterium]|jgi:Ohr subfamily peroxiredoxin